MSVLVMHEKAYEYVLNGLMTTAFNKQCDELYSWAVSSHFKDKDVKAESVRLIRNWAILNELSFNCRYKETGLTHHRQVNKNAIWKVDCYQLLKFIDCIIYNIELETILENRFMEPLKWAEYKADYELLETWCIELTRAIVTKRPEYDSAKWSEEPEKLSLVNL